MKTSLGFYLGVATAYFGISAQGAIVTFNFDESLNIVTTYSTTVGGVTLTLENPNSTSGKFAADSDGLLLTNDPGSGPDSFQFKFSTAVTVVSYEIGFVLNPTAGSFTLSRTGASTTGNDLSSAGSHPINGVFTSGADQTITLTSNPTGTPGWSQLKSFTVNTAVPEPTEAVAVAGGACLMGAWILRSKSAPVQA
jgi:hypothetical protein